MTYKMIQKLYATEFKKTIKSCWIADVKRELGKTSRVAHNRLNKESVKYPCPNGEIKNWLINILSK